MLVPLCVPASVVEVNDGTLRCCEVLWWGECVPATVYYLHSVELTRVEELYDVCGDGIQLRKMVWQSFGAGLPDEYDYYADGSYVSETDISVGSTLSYWFLPLNRVEIRVAGRLVIDGLQEPSHVNLRVRRIPLCIWLAARVKCQPAVW